MARAQQKTSSTERAALNIDSPGLGGHIDYRGLTRGEARSVWISKFSSTTDRALHPENLMTVDRKWRRIAGEINAKPGSKYI